MVHLFMIKLVATWLHILAIISRRTSSGVSIQNPHLMNAPVPVCCGHLMLSTHVEA